MTLTFWVSLIGVSIYFFWDNVSVYFNGDLEPRKNEEKWWLIIHFSSAAFSLFLGPLQFWTYFRNRYRKWHRIAGKIFIGGSLVSAITVFYLLNNYPLPGSIPSLGFLAIIWIFFTLAGFWFAMNKNFHLHKQFMIRSYVCGLAFIFIRLLPYFNQYTGIFNYIKDEEMQGTVYEWICWVYPIVITEFILIWWPSVKLSRKRDN